MLNEPWRIEMLGGMTARSGERAVTRFSTRKAAALLARLAYYPERRHTREELIGLLWPDAELEAGQMSLRTALSSLRRQLEPADSPGSVLLADRTSVQINPAAITTDAAAFLDALKAASSALSDAVPHLDRALGIYQGELLPGFYDDWILSQRDRLAEAHASALRRLTELHEAAGDLERAVSVALRLVEVDPLDEEARRRVMRLYVAADRPAQAARQFEELRRLLAEQLEAEPSPETVELAKGLPRVDTVARPPKAADSHAETAPVAEPEPEAPAGQGSTREDAAAAPLVSLPLTLDAFFGREEERARIVDLLGAGSPGARLVTVTGPGGAGKTRLTLEAARALVSEQRGAAAFVSLADLRRAAEIPEAIARALRIPPSPHVESLSQIVAALEPQPNSLLVLDNFEHVQEEGVGVVLTLLSRVPGLRLLVSSRRRLGVPGEREVPLAPLPLPDGDSGVADLLRNPSVQLFVDRAQAVRPDFQLNARSAEPVAELCRRLDGLPLAIELAAARSLSLTPAQMLERIAERFELLANRRAEKSSRHRSLWAAMDWSFSLLSPELQAFFLKLSVFRGGCTAESAAAVCKEPRALDYLTQLRERSLLVLEAGEAEMRFRMLESLREFALEQLDERGRLALAVSHLRYFTSLSEEAEPKIRTEEQDRWLTRLDAERENLRAAMDFAFEHEAAGEFGLRIAGALAHYWWTRGMTREARETLSRALALPTARERTGHRARALNGLGVAAMMHHDIPAARAAFEEALSIRREQNDEPGVAALLNNLADAFRYDGDYEPAAGMYREALDLNRKLGNKLFQAINLSNLGAIANNLGRLSEAPGYYEESLKLFRELNLPQGIGYALLGLADVASWSGDHERAYSLYAEVREVNRQIGNRAWEVNSANGLGYASLRLGRPDEARGHFSDALALGRETGDSSNLVYSYLGLGEVYMAQGSPRTALSLAGSALNLCKQVDKRVALPRALHLTGEALAELGRPETAATLMGAANHLAGGSMGSEGLERTVRFLRAEEVVRVALGEAAYSAAATEAAKLSPDEAIDLALGYCERDAATDGGAKRTGGK